jgi:hypothetical protein
MRIRITEGSRKAATIVTLCLGLFVVSAVLAVAVSAAAGGVAALLLTAVMVWFCGRTFRGESEDVRPARPWWRLTERPTAGYVLGALFAAQAIGYVTAPLGWGDAILRSLAFIAPAFIAAAFLNSSARLSKAAEAQHSR